MAPLLSTEKLTVTYSEKPVLREISLTVRPGELVALIGPNGSGKSTLLKTLAGILPATNGHILYNGQALQGLTPAAQAKIRAYLPARDECAANFTVLEVVALARYRETTSRAAALKILNDFNLNLLAHKPLSAISSGERQLVNLARTWCQDTPLLLLDEPTNYLDPAHKYLLLTKMRETCAAGRTIIAAIHDLAWASHYFQRFIILNQGQLAADLSPERLPEAKILENVFNLPSDLLLR